MEQRSSPRMSDGVRFRRRILGLRLALWSPPGLVEAALLWAVSCFELRGTEPTEMTMTAHSIVEHLDVTATSVIANSRFL
jgi:hypothetical protein